MKKAADTDMAQKQRLLNSVSPTEAALEPNAVDATVPTIAKMEPGSRSSLNSSQGGGCIRCLRLNLLTLLTCLSVVLGICLGFALRTREAKWTPREIVYINFPGDLFLRMLRCLILPLIVSSLVSALGGLDLQLSGRIGIRAVVYYMTTTLCAVILGIILCVTIHPGSGAPEDIARSGQSRNITVADTLLDLVRNIVPPNLIEACISQYRTVLVYPGYTKKVFTDKDNETSVNATLEFQLEDGINKTKVLTYEELDIGDWKMMTETTDGTNIMGLVMFCVILGIALSKMREKGKPLYNLFASLSEAMMLITHWVIWLSPIGILFLITAKILEMSDFAVIVGQLGMYTATVLIGLAIHGFIVLPIIYTVMTRTLPFRFMFNMMQALTTAFGTASSSAALPVAIACLEENNKVDPRVARFVLPIGATINMDGTALYEAVAALFIAQVREVPMDIGKIIAVSITATAASIGAAGIPQAGLVTMVMVLNAVGLPAEDVTLIIVVDWFLDRVRTMINVLGDSLGAGIVNHLSIDDLKRFDPEKTLNPGSDTQLVHVGALPNKNGKTWQEGQQSTSM